MADVSDVSNQITPHPITCPHPPRQRQSPCAAQQQDQLRLWLMSLTHKTYPQGKPAVAGVTPPMAAISDVSKHHFTTTRPIKRLRPPHP